MASSTSTAYSVQVAVQYVKGTRRCAALASLAVGTIVVIPSRARAFSVTSLQWDHHLIMCVFCYYTHWHELYANMVCMSMAEKALIYMGFLMLYAVGYAHYTSQPCNAERYRLRHIHAREIVAVYGFSPGPSVTRLIS